MAYGIHRDHPPAWELTSIFDIIRKNEIIILIRFIVLYSIFSPINVGNAGCEKRGFWQILQLSDVTSSIKGLRMKIKKLICPIKSDFIMRWYWKTLLFEIRGEIWIWISFRSTSNLTPIAQAGTQTKTRLRSLNPA